MTAITEVSTFSVIPAFVPFGVLYYTQDTGDLYIGTGNSTGPAVNAVNGGGGGTGTVTSVTFTGDGTVLSSTPSAAVTTSGSLSATLKNANANTVLGNTTSTAGTPAYTSSPVITSLLCTDTAANADIIEQNTTTATSGTTNASPTLQFKANYWTGAASALDTWTLGSGLAAGTNGASTLTVGHSGSTGAALVVAPAIRASTVGTASACSVQIVGPNNGFYGSGTGSGVFWVTAGTPIIGLATGPPNVAAVASSAVLGFSPNITSSAVDTAFSRVSAGVMALGNGAASDKSGQLDLATVLMSAASTAPTSAGTAGTVGQVIMNGGNLYLCSVTGAAGSATWNKLSMTSV